MQVRLVFCGRIDVHHQAHIVNVDTPRCDISCDQDANRSPAEGGEVALAGRLPEVAVQLDSGHTCCGELLGQFARAVLGPREQHRPTQTGSEVLDHGRLIGGMHRHQVV